MARALFLSVSLVLVCIALVKSARDLKIAIDESRERERKN